LRLGDAELGREVPLAQLRRSGRALRIAAGLRGAEEVIRASASADAAGRIAEPQRACPGEEHVDIGPRKLLILFVIFRP
jgi:hypothetical protein